MCGISGIIQSTETSFSSDHLKKMIGALSHRGPDGESYWENESGQVMFAHRRLAIIDLSGAAIQPLHYLNRYTIIHNGEIYNYIELKEELEKKGYRFNSQSDTEVILASYDYWKEDCVDHFDGMFAFAIWDEVEKELFAARDRFGEKPFFYYFNNKQLLFASEMKAIFAAGVPRIPNRQMLFNYITIGYTDNPEQPGETFFENIYKLPPASLLSFSTRTNELELERYWDINPAKQQKISDEDAMQQFNSLLNQSIMRRSRSDVKLGSSLSGGLDSSSLVALMNQLQPLNYSTETFTAVFPGFEKDEASYAKEVAEQFGLQQHIVQVSAQDMMNDWSTFCYHQEEPVGSASAYAQYKVFQQAKKQNIKVLLDGQGADETLAGYSKYYKWYWQELFRKGKLFRSKELKAAKAIGVSETFDFKNMIAAYFPSFATIVLERQYLLKAIRQEDLARDFVKLQSKEAYYTTPEHFTLNGILYFNTMTHGLEELLRYADRNSMAHGREVRLPFLNHELVEFIFSLPANFKIRQGWSKWILRESMKNKIPASVSQRRDKVGFEPPQKSWMENKEVQQAILLARKKLVGEHILSPTALNKPVAAMNSYEADNYDWRYLSASTLF